MLELHGVIFKRKVNYYFRIKYNKQRNCRHTSVSVVMLRRFRLNDVAVF